MTELARALLRIDPRSLGAFRIALGTVLVHDLVRRLLELRLLWSNAGVLPNHNHLFNLRDAGPVWSLYHAFSTPGEVAFAFALTLLAYLAFLVGYRTRLSALLSLLALVSLGGRFTLVENAGSFAACGLLSFAVLLPLGARFSLDALLEEDRADAAAPPGAPPTRGPTPPTAVTSLAAPALLMQLAVLLLATAWQRSGAWRDGSALHYALHLDRLVTPSGVAARELLPAAALSGLSRALWAIEWTVPALVFVPFLRPVARGLAAILLATYALVFTALLELGLWGPILLAAVPLLLLPEHWEGLTRRARRARRARVVLYDAACGVCLSLVRLLSRLDRLELLTFRGNRDLAGFPEAVTQELAARTVVTVSPDGRIATEGAAVAEIVAALPLGPMAAFVMRLPGVRGVVDLVYRAVARRRHEISAELGLVACDVAPSAARAAGEGERGAAGGESAPADGGADAAPETERAEENLEPAPAARLVGGLRVAARETIAAALLVTALVQTTHENRLAGVDRLPRPRALEALAVYLRSLQRWDVLVPEPPREDGALVVDAVLKDGTWIDLVTGEPPRRDLLAARGLGLGQAWADYSDKVRRREYAGYHGVLREFLRLGGALSFPADPDRAVTGFDVYWISDRSPGPGERTPTRPRREKILGHGGGGRFASEAAPPAAGPVAR